MPVLGEIATITFARGGSIKGLEQPIIRDILNGKMSASTANQHLNYFVRDGKSWLNNYSVIKRSGKKGPGVQTGVVGQLCSQTMRLCSGRINKTAVVDIGKGHFEPACCGFGHSYDKHGMRVDSNPVHQAERLLGIV